MTDAGATTAWTFATAEGSAGIAVIFLAGPRAFEILSSAFRPGGKKHCGFEAGRLLYGHITEDETVLDEVIVAPFPEGNALFRGPFVEINCHGGVVCSREVGTLLDRLGACGVDRHAFSEAFSRLAGHEEHALERMIQAGTGRAVAVANVVLDNQSRARLFDFRALSRIEADQVNLAATWVGYTPLFCHASSSRGNHSAAISRFCWARRR